jgi:hypothetical protein
MKVNTQSVLSSLPKAKAQSRQAGTQRVFKCRCSETDENLALDGEFNLLAPPSAPLQPAAARYCHLNPTESARLKPCPDGLLLWNAQLGGPPSGLTNVYSPTTMRRFLIAALVLVVALSHSLSPNRLALDWPTLVMFLIFIVLVAELDISRILPFIKRVKIGDVEVEVRKLHEEVEKLEVSHLRKSSGQSA